MMPDSLKKPVMIALIVAAALASGACATVRCLFTKASPKSEDLLTDESGEFPQR